MKRLPKGYGSVYKLSGNRRKPYAARITDGIKENGRPNYLYIGYYEKQEEALSALADYNKNPYNVSLTNSTIADLWEIFKERKFDKLSDSGRTIYNAAYKHLKPIQGHKIKDLKTYQLQTLTDGMTTKWQSKSHVQTLLHQLFEIAMELDIINKNYAAFIKLGTKPQSDIHSTFTEEEIKTLFNNVFSHEWVDTVLIMIYSGMRPSELLSIKTENVHLEEAYIVGGSKTNAGKNRIIPINNKVMPFIKKRYNQQNKYFIEKDGKPLLYKHYAGYFKETMAALNMQHLPHDGRHTFASLMDTAGANKTAIKKIMGHASSDITEKVYTHKAVKELLSNVNMI